MRSSKIPVLVAFLALFAIAACSPEVGSAEWCAQLKEKPKGDWSSNDAAEFAKSCILK